MSNRSNVLNHFHQAGVDGDNILELGGTVFNSAGAQTTPIIDVTGGATVDAEARTAINAVLAHLRATGQVAP